MARNDYCDCYCGGCACCEPESESVSKPVDYNAITPEKATEMLDELNGHGPWQFTGKSHLAALMARRDGHEVVTVDLTHVDPEDLRGLPVPG